MTDVFSAVDRIIGPAASPRERVNRSLLGFMVILTLLLTVGWTFLHVALGAHRVAANLVAYFIANAIALGGLRGSSSTRPWMTLHVGSFLLLPWTATWMEGGFEPSGFICVWAGIAVLEAAVYAGWRWGLATLVVHTAFAIGIAIAQASDFLSADAFAWITTGSDPASTTAGARHLLYVINVVGTVMAALMLTTLARRTDA